MFLECNSSEKKPMTVLVSAKYSFSSSFSSVLFSPKTHSYPEPIRDFNGAFTPNVVPT